MSATTTSTVRFTFGSCDSSILVRTTCAAVDHLCGEADISMSLLDALEVPLSESLIALHRVGVVAVAVTVDESRLVLDVTAQGDMTDDVHALFGESADIVASFFDVGMTETRRTISLTGSLW